MEKKKKFISILKMEKLKITLNIPMEQKIVLKKYIMKKGNLYLKENTKAIMFLQE